MFLTLCLFLSVKKSLKYISKSENTTCSAQELLKDARWLCARVATRAGCGLQPDLLQGPVMAAEPQAELAPGCSGALPASSVPFAPQRSLDWALFQGV